MNLYVALPLLWAIGLTHAGIWALFLKAVNRDRILLAALLDGALTSFGYVAWTVMDASGHGTAPHGIAAYALGGSIGTYIGLRKKLGKT